MCQHQIWEKHSGTSRDYFIGGLPKSGPYLGGMNEHGVFLPNAIIHLVHVIVGVTRGFVQTAAFHSPISVELYLVVGFGLKPIVMVCKFSACSAYRK